MDGCLFIVATPIGHLQDFSPRAIETLRQVSAIACEDTRVSRRLLDAYGIQTPLLTLHQHNERTVAEQILRRLRAGENIGVISDAGTPLVSDPGAMLSALAHEAGIRVIPIPGASAVMAALSAGGLPADRFVFAGFVPSRDGERQRFLAGFSASMTTTVMFETPHRIAATLATMHTLFDGARPLVIARELTKQFEQIVKTTVGAAPDWLTVDCNHARGEFVLLLGGQSTTEQQDWQAFAKDLRSAGLSSRDVAILLARHWGASKKQVYSYLVDGEKAS